MFDGQGQQGRLEFVVRFVGQDGLGLCIGAQLLRDGRGSADEISLVGNVGHDDGPGGLQPGAEGGVQWRAGLDDVSPGIAPGAQVLGNRQGGGLGRVEQGVFKQDGSRAADQLAEGRKRVAEAKGRGMRERIGGWSRREDSGLADGEPVVQLAQSRVAPRGCQLALPMPKAGARDEKHHAQQKPDQRP